MRTLFVLISVVWLAGCINHQQKVINERDRYLSMTVDEYRSLVTIKDDALESFVTFSTKKGFKQEHGLANVIWNDFFLRGFLDKKTGTQSIQVYAALEHTYNRWLFPYQANYGKPLIITSVTKLGKDVDCSNSDLYNSCVYKEHVAFSIDQKEVNRIRGVIQENSTNQFWVFRLKTHGGIDIDDGFSKNEFRALLEAMDSYAPIPAQ